MQMRIEIWQANIDILFFEISIWISNFCLKFSGAHRFVIVVANPFLLIIIKMPSYNVEKVKILMPYLAYFNWVVGVCSIYAFRI
ncbi:MAG: hypothetical protein CMI27_05550 [Opitutae bacterium]|nr:hypothetical protein [Opitutae bacterium]